MIIYHRWPTLKRTDEFRIRALEDELKKDRIVIQEYNLYLL